MKITKQQLLEILLTLRGTKLISLVSETVPKMRKTNNPFYNHLTKLSYINGMINFSYENAVNKQRDIEEHPEAFVAAERRWGTRRTVMGLNAKGEARTYLTPIVEHKGEAYLEIKIERILWSEFRFEGKTIREDKVMPYLNESSSSNLQELDNEIVLRDYKLSNIRAININSETYEVE